MIIIEIESKLKGDCHQSTNSLNEIELLEELSYNEFFQNYLIPNRLVLIKNVSDDWECMKNWLKNDGNIDFNYLAKRFKSDHQVPVANCSKKYFDSHEKIKMNLGDFLNYWQRLISANYQLEEDVLYLKDWHLKKELCDYNFYKIPSIFASDWLNEFLVDTGRDDYSNNKYFI